MSWRTFLLNHLSDRMDWLFDNSWRGWEGKISNLPPHPFLSGYRQRPNRVQGEAVVFGSKREKGVTCIRAWNNPKANTSSQEYVREHTHPTFLPFSPFSESGPAFPRKIPNLQLRHAMRAKRFIIRTVGFAIIWSWWAPIFLLRTVSWPWLEVSF